MPFLKLKRKMKTDWKCYNIIREKDEQNKLYKRIKRKEYYTIQNEEEKGNEENMINLLK